MKIMLYTLGTLCTIVSLIQLHPAVRRRFRERGFSDDIVIPSLMTFCGILMILLGWLKEDAAEHNLLSQKIDSIYWSDGDSGKIKYDNGKAISFRLNGVDAPETGGVGAAIGGAKCELERERGFDAKEWVVTVTRDVELNIAKDYGLDKYERLVIDLSANGEDVASSGINMKHLKPWPHKGRRALSKKPDWCI